MFIFNKKGEKLCIPSLFALDTSFSVTTNLDLLNSYVIILFLPPNKPINLFASYLKFYFYIYYSFYNFALRKVNT